MGDDLIQKLNRFGVFPQGMQPLYQVQRTSLSQTVEFWKKGGVKKSNSVKESTVACEASTSSGSTQSNKHLRKLNLDWRFSWSRILTTTNTATTTVLFKQVLEKYCKNRVVSRSKVEFSLSNCGPRVIIETLGERQNKISIK